MENRKTRNEFLEKEEYLAQFPESERGIQLVEMKLNNIKLSLQLALDKRFTSGLDFYADYVKQRVKRESCKSDKEYHEALENEAWKAGYAYATVVVFLVIRKELVYRCSSNRPAIPKKTNR